MLNALGSNPSLCGEEPVVVVYFLGEKFPDTDEDWV
jgi:hypothetical protein